MPLLVSIETFLGPGVGMLNRILGGKVRERREVRDKEVHARKGYRDARWRRDLERACSTRFWERKYETKREVRGMWNETQAK